ncbi:MAG: LytR family transcriptional regulator, partial [Actinobacteria bacterium]|nr:LytR family transcriptional regulator [Actinomycetota bacterium]
MKRRHRHAVLTVILVTHLCLALVTGTAVVLVYRHLNTNLDIVDVGPMLTDRPDKVRVEGPKEPLNILVLGDDTRACDGCDIDNEAGSGGSDTTILIHVSADRKDAYGVSLPRDAMVTRPDCTAEDGSTIPGGELQMFNTAYSLGGAACTIQTMEQLTGIRIDHYVTIDFNGF